MKKGEVIFMIMANFSKVFDIVQYKTLITKLRYIGFSKSFWFWLTSYLADRSHFVQIDDKTSCPLTVQFVVPQGSILGPMLFKLYVSGLVHTMPDKFENATLLLRFGLPSTLQRTYPHKKIRENGTF